MASPASILDQDLYKLTMGRAVLERHPEVEAEYEFIDRRGTAFNGAFLDLFAALVAEMPALRLSRDEKAWLRQACPFLGVGYLEFLENFRYDPAELDYGLAPDGRFRLAARGKWHRTIYWEVPLLALVSECYFRTVDVSWTHDGNVHRARAKGERLDAAGLSFADFGTRRRRDLRSQEDVVRALSGFAGFVGTSNVFLAHRHGTKPIGTMAHEWVMAASVLRSMRYANRDALDLWDDVYRGDLGIALTDTYGTEAFFRDFDKRLARLYDGVRQDSGDPFAFVDRVVAHYESLRIDPTTKTIVFSDALDVDKAIRLAEACRGRIRCSFGIGTHFTNDFPGSPALNVVMKLKSVDGMPVVKLGDDPGKSTGDRDALRVARYIHHALPLDATRTPAPG